MWRKIGGWAANALALSTCLACTREPKSEPAPVATASATTSFSATAPKQSAAAERRRWRGHTRGPVGTLLGNLRVLELSAQQESAVAAIEADLRGGSDPWQLRGELARAVAAELRGTKIDRARLEPQLKAARVAASEENARQAKALNTLHATLDEAQRRALVRAIRARQERGAQRSTFGGKIQDAQAGPNARRAQRELERMSRELELDPQQREKVEKTLLAHPNFGGPSREAREPSAALLDALEKPTFDATKLDLDPGEKAFNERLDYLKKLAAILTPKQRDKLASSLIDRGGFEHKRKPPTGETRETESDDEAAHGNPPNP